MKTRKKNNFGTVQGLAFAPPIIDLVGCLVFFFTTLIYGAGLISFFGLIIKELAR